MQTVLDDGWFTVERIDAETFAISEYGHWEEVHSYLVIGQDRAALVDSGLGLGNIRAVVEALTTLPVSVITTHVHWDHIGGHGWFEDIGVNALDAGWLEHGIPVPLAAQRAAFMAEPLRRLPPGDFSIERWQPYRGKPTRLLSDGELIDLGGRSLTVLHTPGHSPGHVCLYEEARGHLITGDLIYRGELHAFYPSTDPMAFASSVHRLCSLPRVELILPGHHGIDLGPDDLRAIDAGFAGLASAGLLHHGSGVHEAGPVRIRL